MNSARLVIKNSIYLVAVRVVVPISSFVIFLAIARTMGVQAVGHYTLIVTMFFVFNILSSLGLNPLLVRELTQRPDSRGSLYSSAVYLGIVSLLFWAPLMVAVAWLAPYSSEVFVCLCILATGLPFAYVILVNEALLMGVEKFKYIPVINVAESIFLLAASLAVIALDLGLVALALCLAASKAVSAAVGTRIVFRRVEMERLGFDRASAWGLARLVPPFFLMYAFGFLFYRIDILQLSLMVPSFDLGLYSTANKIYLFALIVPEAFVRALYPRISTLAADADIRSITLRCIRYAMIGFGPLVLTIFVLGRDATTLVFGGEYEDSARALTILIWALFPFVANAILGNVLIIAGHQWFAGKLVVLVTLANVVLNYVLIKSIGFPGAALATTASLLGTTFVGLWAVGRKMFSVQPVVDFLLPCMPTVAGGAVSLVWAWGGVWGRLAAACFTALVLAFGLRQVKWEDISWLRRKLLSRRTAVGA